jgi:uncharacterized protein YdaU (DUF1376 family)
MKKPECFLFNVKDWLSSLSVEAMSGEQVKAFVYLLCRAWDNDPIATLPDDDEILARLARISREKWDEIKGPIRLQFKPYADGLLHNSRLSKEAQHWNQRQLAGASWSESRRKRLAERNTERVSKRKSKRKS